MAGCTIPKWNVCAGLVCRMEQTNSNYLGAVGSVCAEHVFFLQVHFCIVFYMWIDFSIIVDGSLKTSEHLGQSLLWLRAETAQKQGLCGHYCLDYLISGESELKVTLCPDRSPPRKGNEMTGYFPATRQYLLHKLHKECLKKMNSDIVKFNTFFSVLIS